MEQQENEHITNNTTESTALKTKTTTTIAAAIITGAAMIAIALLLVLHPAGGSAATGATTNGAPTTPTTIPATIATLRSDDMAHIRGNSNAQILIFEYSDSDCPFCQQFHPTLQQVVNDYKGQVAWVYRFFPLSIHPDSHNESVALQCVSEIGGAKAFNAYLDTLVNITLTPNSQTMTTLATFAQQQGIDATKFKTCVNDPATTAIVDNGIKEAASIGAQGTPFSIIVNTKTGKQIIVPGAYPLAQIKQDIDSLLK